MPISSTNYTDFSYVKETTPGTTPDTPAFQRLPVTGVNLSDSLAAAVSEVIRSDRQTDDLVIVDSEVGGDCNYELSYAAFKPIIASLLQGGDLVTIDQAASDVTVTASTKTFSSAGTINFATAGLLPGCRIRVAGFTNAANNGVFKVATVTAGAFTVEETITDEAAGNAVTFDVSFVRNGAEDMDTYTFRKQINAPSASNAIFYYRGCAINTMSFEFASGSILNGSFGVMGRTSEGTDTEITGETIADVASYRIMNGVSSVTSIDISGLPATTAFSSLSLNVDNQINAAKAIGVLGAADLAPFSLKVTADIEIYFEDLSMYDAYKDSTEFSLGFTLEDASVNPNIMTIDLPKCKFEELSEPVDGKDAFLMESGSLRALRHATLNHMIQVCFFDAA